jgi:hypothetical protein
MKLNAGRVALASATAINKLGPLTRDGEDYEWTISNVGKLMLRKVDSGVQNFASFITANKYDAGPVGYNLAIRESVKISPVFASILEQDPSSAQPRLQVRGGKGGRRQNMRSKLNKLGKFAGSLANKAATNKKYIIQIGSMKYYSGDDRDFWDWLDAAAEQNADITDAYMLGSIDDNMLDFLSAAGFDAYGFEIDLDADYDENDPDDYWHNADVDHYISDAQTGDLDVHTPRQRIVWDNDRDDWIYINDEAQPVPDVKDIEEPPLPPTPTDQLVYVRPQSVTSSSQSYELMSHKEWRNTIFALVDSVTNTYLCSVTFFSGTFGAPFHALDDNKKRNSGDIRAHLEPNINFGCSGGEYTRISDGSDHYRCKVTGLKAMGDIALVSVAHSQTLFDPQGIPKSYPATEGVKIGTEVHCVNPYITRNGKRGAVSTSNLTQITDNKGVKMYRHRASTFSGEGSCGLPLITATESGISILGIHLAGTDAHPNVNQNWAGGVYSVKRLLAYQKQSAAVLSPGNGQSLPRSKNSSKDETGGDTTTSAASNDGPSKKDSPAPRPLLRRRPKNSGATVSQ